MRIAVINEISASHRNKDIIEALSGFDHEVYNVGMKNPDENQELTYIHTGLMSALLLNLKAVDMVIGGCGTGQGYLNSVMQYPGVICGVISDPLEAWLFSKINAGNCISLALNKGYGWASDINIKYIFEKLFKDVPGGGYPENRQESQKKSREKLSEISNQSHKSMNEILEIIDKDIIGKIFSSKDFCKVITENSQNGKLKDLVLSKYISR